MSGNISSRAPGTARAVAMPPLGCTSGSTRPWMTSVGAVHPAAGPRCGPGWPRSPSSDAPCRAGRSCGSNDGSAIWRASSSSKCGPEISRNVSTPLVDRRPRACGAERLRQLAQQRRLDPPVPAVAGVRHDRRQDWHPPRVLDGHRLGDHPAHRRADDVGGVDAEVVEQPDGVGRHVAERVRRLGRTAARRADASIGADRRRRRVGSSSTGRCRGCRSGSPGSPRSTQRSTKSGGQPMSWPPRPITSSSGSPVAVVVVLDRDAR